MKKKCMFIMLLLAFYCAYSVQVFADRGLPAKIAPVIYNNVKIVAENSSPENMGVVQAFDVKTNKLIWSTRVYKVKLEIV